MLKIKLLNNGGYKSLENLKFPVVIDGFLDPRYPGVMCVLKSEMKKCGAEIELSGLSFIIFFKGEYESLST